MKDKCTNCPECGCIEYAHENYLGEGFRVCTDCGQEWYAGINYKKYSSPAYYFEVFTCLGRSLPTKDRNGDSNRFDKRSIKRRIRKLIRQGFTVTVFETKKDKKREIIYSNWPPNAVDSQGFTTKSVVV